MHTFNLGGSAAGLPNFFFGFTGTAATIITSFVMFTFLLEVR
jgi:hypothetical protein